MLFPTSYSSKETKQAINSLIGEPFGIIQSVRMGGIGSQRLLVNEACQEIQKLLEQQNNPPYTNIELRPKGVLLRFRVRLDNWSLALPYADLKISHNSNELLLICNKWELKLAPTINDLLDGKFIHKLMKLKSKGISNELKAHS